jgi:hypothetical protein
MKASMRQTIIKVLLIVGVPAVISFFYYRKLAGFAPGDTLLRQKMDWLYSAPDKPGVIFLGSSRMLNHIDPRIIDSVCRVDSYNLGLDGVNITEMRMLLKVCIEVGKVPKFLVINLDHSSFDAEDAVWSFTDLLYYAERDTVVFHAMADGQDVFAYKWKYPFYRLQKVMSLNDGLKLNAFFKRDAVLRRKFRDDNGPVSYYYKGFRGVYRGYSGTYVNPFEAKFQEKGFGMLRDIIRLCRQEGIRLVLVTAPMYKDYRATFLNAGAVLGRLREEAVRGGVPYFDLIDDSLARRRENFYNFVHLNGWAAERYSLELANILNRLDTALPKPIPQ